MINFLRAACIGLLVLPGFAFAKKTKTGEFYKITIYHFTTAANGSQLDEYLSKAMVPALHRQKLSQVGVFVPLSNDTAADKKIYVIYPLKSLDESPKIADALVADAGYQSAGKSFLDLTYEHPAFTRIETILLKAFPLAPFMKLPKLNSPAGEHVYELRSYESATEPIHRNKVQMFNEGGEVSLFARLNFNAVFYASVIAGSHMPNLMYMTSFENMADRDAHWKSFGADPEWKKLSALPEYLHNVSKSDIVFLKAAPYSDY